MHTLLGDKEAGKELELGRQAGKTERGVRSVGEGGALKEHTSTAVSRILMPQPHEALL